MSHLSPLLLMLTAFVGSQDPLPPNLEVKVTVPTFANATCPIMGKPASKSLFAETPKGRIYMCCKACTKKILADVDKSYQAAYPNLTKAGNKVCPILGEKIEEGSPTVVLQGVELNVCCEDCVADAPKMSQLVLTRATLKNSVDIANKTCPVTDKPATADTFCLIGENIVHLSSIKCVDDVRKDPAKFLAKALELKQKEAKESAAKGGDKRAHKNQ